MNNQRRKAAPSGVNAYQQTNVMTASRENILLMLYQGAIRFLKGAIQANDRKDIAERNRLVGRTMDIINELEATLNHEVGGEISKTLEQLYDYMNRRLIDGIVEQNGDYLAEVLKLLEDLNETWSEAIRKVKEEKKVKPNKSLAE